VAIKEFYIGSVGPLQYDDAGTYSDTETLVAFRGPQIHIEDAPSEDYHAARYADIPSVPNAVLVNGIYINSDNVNPATPLGYGTWSLLGTQTIGTTPVYYWQRTA
jgi:hypothetical protein